MASAHLLAVALAPENADRILAAVRVLALVVAAWAVWGGRATWKRWVLRGVQSMRGPAGSSRRDLALVAAFATVTAAVQLYWIAQYRHRGALDFDEARYLAGAIQYNRFITLQEAGDLRTHFYGPAMPLLSAVAMLVGPISARTAIAAPLILNVGIAVSAAGVAQRLTVRWAAVFAGVAVAILPVTLSSSQVYLLVTGAAFGFTAGMWALLTSDRGDNWRVWLVGPLFALAPLSRGMTLGLLPAAAGGAIVYCWPSPRGRRRVALTLALAVAALTTWLLGVGGGVVNYVLGGLTSTSGQTYHVTDRVWFRVREFSDDLGRPLLYLGLALGAVGIVRTLRRRTTPLSIIGSEWAAVGTFVGGASVLMLTGGFLGDRGYWNFPIDPLLVVLLVAASARAVHGRAAAALAIGSAVWLLYLSAASFWVIGPDAPLIGWGMGRYASSKVEANPFDPRFTPERRDEQYGAMREWWNSSVAIDQQLRAIDERSLPPLEVFYMGGSSGFVEHSSWILAAIELRDPVVYYGDAGSGTAEDLAAQLQPKDPVAERVLLIPRIGRNCVAGGGCARTAGEQRIVEENQRYRDVRELERIALRAGWRQIDQVALPLGDRMVILAPPDMPSGTPG